MEASRLGTLGRLLTPLERHSVLAAAQKSYLQRAREFLSWTG